MFTMSLPPQMRTLVALLMLSLHVQAADVWKVASPRGHVYVGGTFHLLTPADYPLPPEYDAAYLAAQTIVLETDLDRLRDPAFARTMQRTLQYPPGRNVIATLKPDTVRQVKAYLAAKKIPFEDLAMLRPGMLSVTLTMIELSSLGLTGTGVDEHFHQRAQQDGKPLRWFESAEQQLEFLARMGEGREDELIAYTLADMKNIPRLMADMKSAWRRGDSAALEASSLQPYVEDFPELMDMLLHRRNDDWIPTIEQMIDSDGTEFLLVGALHLVGERGLLAQLRRRGYTVEKLATQPR